MDDKDLGRKGGEGVVETLKKQRRSGVERSELM